MRRTCLAVVALIAGIVVSGAGGEETRVGDLAVVSPWARASAGLASTGVVYLTIENRGDAADRLIKVVTSVAGQAELHATAEKDGVMKMLPAEEVPVAAGGSVVLAPGGLHIMLMGLKSPLKEGERFPITLTFEKAGELRVEVPVEGVGAMGPAVDHQMHEQ